MNFVTKVALAFTIVGVSLAVAQTQQPPQTFKFEVDAKGVELIGKGLGLLPYNDVAGLMNSLQNQIIAQSKASPVPAPLPTNPNTNPE